MEEAEIKEPVMGSMAPSPPSDRALDSSRAR